MNLFLHTLQETKIETEKKKAKRNKEHKLFLARTHTHSLLHSHTRKHAHAHMHNPLLVTAKLCHRSLQTGNRNGTQKFQFQVD